MKTTAFFILLATVIPSSLAIAEDDKATTTAPLPTFTDAAAAVLQEKTHFIVQADASAKPTEASIYSTEIPGDKAVPTVTDLSEAVRSEYATVIMPIRASSPNLNVDIIVGLTVAVRATTTTKVDGVKNTTVPVPEPTRTRKPEEDEEEKPKSAAGVRAVSSAAALVALLAAMAYL